MNKHFCIHNYISYLNPLREFELFNIFKKDFGFVLLVHVLQKADQNQSS